jgi:hypothetical protein
VRIDAAWAEWDRARPAVGSADDLPLASGWLSQPALR